MIQRMMIQRMKWALVFVGATAFLIGASGASGLLASETSEDSEGSVTFHEDIEPIFQAHCQDCHRPSGKNFGGMVAPMSLIDYDEVRPWARAIAKQVLSKEMPPWDADPKFHGVFANERTLTQDQIEKIETWVKAGAPKGDAAKAKAPRNWKDSGGWIEGEPDLVLTIPTAYHVSDETGDQYTAFAVDLTEDMLPEDVYVRGFQCKPGVKIIHHFNAHVLPPDENGELPPKPTSFESSSISPKGAGMYLGGVSSGSDANMYPEGYGLKLKKGSRVTFDIHYHKEPGPGTGVTDETSQIGFYFSKEKPKSAMSGVSMFHFNHRHRSGRKGLSARTGFAGCETRLRGGRVDAPHAHAWQSRQVRGVLPRRIERSSA